MSRTTTLLVLCLWGVCQRSASAQDFDPSAASPPGALPHTELPAPPESGASPESPAGEVPMDVCGTHESMQKFAREASRLVSSREAPYFMVRQRLIRVNEHYLAMHERLGAMMPPKNDAAAEMLWRFNALGELLQDSSTNLERLAREMKTASRVCGHDIAAYEAEFGAACPNEAEPGCAEAIFVRYCDKARKRNRVLKIDEETQTGFFKWPRYFDTHWAGPTAVGEAGEGWREDWTYGTEEQVWENLGHEAAQDENRLLLLGAAETAYSNYTMIDTKQLLARMIYNEMHGTMNGGGDLSLPNAIDTVALRIRKVMQCESTVIADKPRPPAGKDDAETPAAAGPAAAAVE